MLVVLSFSARTAGLVGRSPVVGGTVSERRGGVPMMVEDAVGDTVAKAVSLTTSA